MDAARPLVVVGAIGVIAFWPTPFDRPVAAQINDTLVRMLEAGMHPSIGPR